MKIKFTLIAFVAFLTSIKGVAQEYNVTFQLNTNTMTETFTTPEVNGVFNNWCGGCAPMSDEDGDGIWTITIALPAGQIEYKFAYDSWAGQETLVAGSSCTLTTGQFTNRTYVVSQDVTLPLVCWGSCDDCGINNGPYNVTFQVDMNNVTAPFTTPEVNGTFNNWCGGCAPMSDADGDGIWELTIALNGGSYEYKFAYDSWAGQETLTAGTPCTITTENFTNRFLAVTEDATLEPFCWGSCTACIVSVDELTSLSDLALYPNPAQDNLTIPAISGNGTARILDVTGKEVMNSIRISTGAQQQIDISALPVGSYLLIVTTENTQGVSKFSVVR